MMSLQSQRLEPLSPRTEQYTVWHNPTDHEQYVDVFFGEGVYNEKRPTRYTFPPRQDVQVPSRFDSAIQLVQCQEESCRRLPRGFCVDPEHAGVVIGGRAPMLKRKGSNYKVLPALDPTHADLEAAKAQLAAADIARKAAENAQLLAEQRRQEAEEKLEAVTRPPTETTKAPQKK